MWIPVGVRAGILLSRATWLCIAVPSVWECGRPPALCAPHPADIGGRDNRAMPVTVGEVRVFAAAAATHH